MSREYHYGNNFGYIVAFKPFDGEEWKKVTVTNPDIGRYVHKDETMRPYTAFQVKVKAFNNKGDGPYSLIAVINSAQDGRYKKDLTTMIREEKPSSLVDILFAIFWDLLIKIFL